MVKKATHNEPDRQRANAMTAMSSETGPTALELHLRVHYCRFDTADGCTHFHMGPPTQLSTVPDEEWVLESDQELCINVLNT